MAAVVVRRGGTMRVSRRAFASCALIGCLLPGANAVLFFAEQQVPIGLASLLIASVPLLVVVLRLLGRERLPAAGSPGSASDSSASRSSLQPSGGATVGGIALCILSAIMWAVGSVASARLPMPSDPFTATSWEMLVGGVLMLPFGLATAGSFSPSTCRSLAWLYLVTFGSVVGYTAYVWLLANAPLGTRLDLRLRQPGRGDHPRRPLPQRA